MTQATENLNAVAHQMTREHPNEDDGLSARLVKPGLLGDLLGGPARPFMTAIMALALLVLAAACTNLAGIFAARSSDRTRELAIRLSIGATRWRLLRQILTEAVLIAILGGHNGIVCCGRVTGRADPLAADRCLSHSRGGCAGCPRVPCRHPAIAGQRHTAGASSRPAGVAH